MVDGFPKKLNGEKKITYMKSIDYDNNSNFRFLIQNQTNTVTLYDKSFKTIDGWQNPKVSGILKFVGHYNWNSKDYIAIIDNKGIAFYNRKGEVRLIPAGLPTGALIENVVFNNGLFYVTVKKYGIYKISTDGKSELFINTENKIYDLIYNPKRNMLFVVFENQINGYELNGKQKEIYKINGRIITESKCFDNEILTLPLERNRMKIFNLTNQKNIEIKVPEFQTYRLTRIAQEENKYYLSIVSNDNFLYTYTFQLN